MKILLNVPIGMSAGYSRDGIGLARALVERGHSVTLDPNRVSAPLPADIAQMLSVEHFQKPPFDIRIVHQAPQDVILPDQDVWKAKQNIYWSMWEWQDYPAAMVEDFTYRTKNFDTFVAYDEGSMDALGPHIGNPDAKKIICQGGYESEDWKYSSRHDKPEAFWFGTLGEMSQRKNPAGLIRAYKLFKDKNPEANTVLIIKSKYPFRSWAIGPYIDREYNIVEIVEMWDREELEAFYRDLGAYVAPSMGEGKNLPALEAATHGVPLILSDIPGHRQWASGLSSVKFVNGEYGNVFMAGQPVTGLYVDVEALADTMYEVYMNQHYYSNEAKANIGTIVSSMDWYKRVENLGILLENPFL